MIILLQHAKHFHWQNEHAQIKTRVANYNCVNVHTIIKHATLQHNTISATMVLVNCCVAGGHKRCPVFLELENKCCSCTIWTENTDLH